MRPDSAPKAWRALFEGGPLDGMPYIELESLRHTHVTLAVAGGASDEANSYAHGRGELVSYSHYLKGGDAVAASVAKAIAAASWGA